MRISRRGFSLLEVMVALAIFGLMIAGILAAQAGLAASNKKAANMGEATTMARCKQTELEEKLIRLGYPAMDDIENGVECCEGAGVDTFTCDYKVETVVMPDPPTSSALDDGGMAAKLLGESADGGAPSASLDFDGGLGAIGSLLGPGGGNGQTGGAAGLVDMAMGIVYPMMKPMMEASIRKITVTVHWKEGPNPQEFVLAQYVTNPQTGGFTGGMFGGDAGAPLPGATGASTAPTPGGGVPGSTFRATPLGGPTP